MASAFPATIPVRLDGEGRIDIDVHCPSCNYNLRMQRVEGACPECGAAVDVVDREAFDMLDRADPRWRRRVSRGAKWLHWGAISTLPLVLPGVLLATAGLWLLTTREPGRPEDWRARGTRLSARWASVGSAVSAVWLAALMTQRPEGFSRSTLLAKDWLLGDVLLCAVAASMAVGLLEAWRHLFKLAARADSPSVAQACRRTWKRYLIGVGTVVALAAGIKAAERFRLDLPDAWNGYALAAAFGIVALVMVWLWWATVRLTRDFRALL